MLLDEYARWVDCQELVKSANIYAKNCFFEDFGRMRDWKLNDCDAKADLGVVDSIEKIVHTQNLHDHIESSKSGRSYHFRSDRQPIDPAI